MPEASDSAAARGAARNKERRLESWGEIASYLRREIRTVQRWEKTLGLPVHRMSVGKLSSVFAYPSELDEWFREREKTIPDDDHTDPAIPVQPPTPSPELKPVDDEHKSKPAAQTDPPHAKRLTARIVAIGAVLALAVAVGTVILWPSKPSTTGTLRLFVRPFATAAGDASQIEFTDGLTNEINTRLGKLDPEHLGVIAPTSSKKLSDKSISELESLLKLNYVLEGSVQRANEKVRVDVSLISAKEQTALWSDSYTGNLSDILKVQDEVAEAVAQHLLNHLPPSGTKPAAKVDPEGYDSYLRGRRSWTVRDLAHSIPAFEAAVDKLPQYVPAHVGLAESYALMGESPNNVVPPSLSGPKAKAEVQRALALDPANAEAHVVRGNILMYYDWNFPAAESELREAIRLEPNNPTAHQWLGEYFITQNRLAEARAETGKALELDPVSPIFTTALAETSYYARDYDDTIHQAQLTLEQFPNFLLGEYWLASAYREKKMYPQALEHFRKAGSLVPGNPALLMALGHALAVSGDAQGAKAILAQLQTLSHQRYVPVLYLAAIYVGLGDRDNAFKYMDRAVAEHDDFLIYLAVEPMADPLRGDPRFQTLLAQVNLIPPKR